MKKDQSIKNRTFLFLSTVDNDPPRCQNVPNDILTEITVGTPSRQTPVDWTEPTAIDNCGPVTLVSRSNAPNSLFSVGPTPVTYVFADESGNSVTCSFEVEVLEGKS